jgi:hypothetical protein
LHSSQLDSSGSSQAASSSREHRQSPASHQASGAADRCIFAVGGRKGGPTPEPGFIAALCGEVGLGRLIRERALDRLQSRQQTIVLRPVRPPQNRRWSV